MLAESPRFLHPQFQTDVTKPMLIDQIADHNVRDPLDIFPICSMYGIFPTFAIKITHRHM